MTTPKFLTCHRQCITSLSRSLSTSLASQSRRRVTTATSRGSSTASPSLHVPPLMDLPNIVKPSLRNAIPNWFFSRALITPYFDPEFSRKEFDEGAHRWAPFVANCIAEGDLDSLSGLVTSKAIQEIDRNLSAFSPDERRLLAVSDEDIYYSFVHHIGIGKNDGEDLTKMKDALTGRVEIMWVGHSFPNYASVVAEHENSREVKKHVAARGGPIVLNYQFIKEFTMTIYGYTDLEDTWQINALNHFNVNTSI